MVILVIIVDLIYLDNFDMINKT